jgi:hypothetical protein
LLVVYPGQIGPSRRIVDVLRERHDDNRAAVLAEIEHRTKGGTPLTESIDWAAEAKAARELVALVEAQQETEVQRAYQRGAGAFAVVPRDPGEFVAPSGLDGVTLRPRHIPARESLALRRAMAAAYADGDDLAAAEAEAALVARVVAEVGGLTTVAEDGREIPIRIFAEGKDGALSAEDIEALRGSGLLPWLVVVSAWWQVLPAGKVQRSGVLPPST